MKVTNCSNSLNYKTKILSRQISLQGRIIPSFQAKINIAVNFRLVWVQHHQLTMRLSVTMASQKMYLFPRNYRFSHISKKPRCVFLLQSRRIHHYTNTSTCVKAVRFRHRKFTHNNPTSCETVSTNHLLPTSTQRKLSNLIKAT